MESKSHKCAGCLREIDNFTLKFQKHCSAHCKAMCEAPKCHFCKRVGRVKIKEDFSICTYCFQTEVLPCLKTCYIAEYEEREVNRLCGRCLKNQVEKGEHYIIHSCSCKECIEGDK